MADCLNCKNCIRQEIYNGEWGMFEYDKICSECNGKQDIKLNNFHEYLHKYRNDNRCDKSYINKQILLYEIHTMREPKIITINGITYVEDIIEPTIFECPVCQGKGCIPTKNGEELLDLMKLI